MTNPLPEWGLPTMQKELLLTQMDATFADGGWTSALARAVSDLPAEAAAWKPEPGVHSIWELVNHLAFWKEIVARRIGGAPLTSERFDNKATFGQAGDPATWALVRERLFAAHRACREAVLALAEADLEQPLPGERQPLKELIAGLNRHDAYHVGQIALLRKLQHLSSQD
jgi:uncharacterized damage-inducible protein DinB